MAGRIFMKTGDLRPIVEAQLGDRNGPVNLTGATVLFIMKLPTASVPKVSAQCVIVDAPLGRVQYTWVGTDTDTPGAYRSEFQVSLPGGVVVTFPNDDYVPTIIADDLD